jgi:hypothetical protein
MMTVATRAPAMDGSNRIWKVVMLLGATGVFGWLTTLKSLAAGPVMATADAPLYDGSWSAWLGGYNNANDKLFQGFTVPAGCKSLKIVAYVDVYSIDSLILVFDKLYGSLQPLNSVSNPEPLIATNRDHSSNVNWRRMTYVYNQIPNPGQPLRLYLHATTDSSNYTNFFVDLVSIEASTQSFSLPATTIQTADGGVIGWEIEDISAEEAAELNLAPPAGGRANAR